MVGNVKILEVCVWRKNWQRYKAELKQFTRSTQILYNFLLCKKKKKKNCTQCHTTQNRQFPAYQKPPQVILVVNWRRALVEQWS